IAEPIQGEGGDRHMRPEFLRTMQELCHDNDALFVLDEVQTGMGRTGSWLAYQQPEIGGGIVPDAVTLAKGLGGGFPVGALVAYGERTATLLGRGQHGTTFGGNPVAAAAGLATIAVIERDGLLEHVRTLGVSLRDRVAGLGHPLVTDVRGAGLLIAIELARPVAPQVAAAALDAGFVVNPCTPTTIRLAPPFVLTEEQAGTFVDFLAAVPADLGADA
ncbi:aminotransferase class III-fold pyridoxal phosphate-dependent enzyme, partial [Cellulomonas septica]